MLDNINDILFNRLFLILYFSVCFIVFIFLQVGYYNNRETSKLQGSFLLLFSICFLFLFGFRNFEVGVDTMTYLSMFSNAEDFLFVDFGFGFFNKFLHGRVTERTFIFLMAFLYIMPLYFAIVRFSSKNKLFIFFCVISFFFFKSMGMNTMRQGVAFSLFFLSLSYNKNNWLKYVLIFFALSMHLSMIFPILVYGASNYIKNLKFPFFIFFICTLLSVIKFNIYGLIQNIPLIAIADKIDSYSNLDTSDYKIGFRPDFFVFNLIFVFIGYFIYTKVADQRKYLKYLSSYLILSGIFIVMFNSGFSDRYGFLSWIFIPLLILPVLNGDKINRLITVSSILSFCFFIAVVFYIIK
ncbi:EpsG family protein [Flavobacterium sp. XN-5]|uniref:EpsG family protein n=1 Tax=Flavobacterium sp. XN-5 TaxID=2599390 RepID=UPI0011CCBF5C|nr:EpsG family protein [Flavobacterium sp. XN-5]NGY37422.1 EpsG family protein [Flavobacterium sp. XN-5]